MPLYERHDVKLNQLAVITLQQNSLLMTAEDGALLLAPPQCCQPRLSSASGLEE